IAPSASFDSGPSQGSCIGSTSVTFTWTVVVDTTLKSVADAQTSYHLDGGGYSPYVKGAGGKASVSGLVEGPRTRDVRGLDRFGVVGTSSRNFSVDLTPPITTFAGGPGDGGWANTRDVIFVWSGKDDCSAASLAFSYRLDDAPWSAYAAQTFVTLKGLDAG